MGHCAVNSVYCVTLFFARGLALPVNLNKTRPRRIATRYRRRWWL